MEDHFVLPLCSQDDWLIISKGVSEIGEIYRLFVFIEENESGHKRGIRTRKPRRFRWVRRLSTDMENRIAQVLDVIQNGVVSKDC